MPPCIETLIFLKVSGAESFNISTLTFASLSNNCAGNAGVITGCGTGNAGGTNLGTAGIYTGGIGAIIIIGIGPAGVAIIILTGMATAGAIKGCGTAFSPKRSPLK